MTADTTQDGRAAAQRALQAGTQLYEANRPDLAERWLREALAADPVSARAHAILGWALVRLGRPAEALRETEVALSIAPDLAIAHAGAARAYGAMHRWRHAIASMREALRLEPASAAHHANYSMILNRAGRAPDARRAAEAGLAIDPNHSMCLNNLAAALLAMGEVARAEQVVRTALEARPTDPYLASNLSVTLLHGGDVEGAHQAAAAALAEDPLDVQRLRIVKYVDQVKGRRDRFYFRLWFWWHRRHRVVRLALLLTAGVGAVGIWLVFAWPALYLVFLALLDSWRWVDGRTELGYHLRHARWLIPEPGFGRLSVLLWFLVLPLGLVEGPGGVLGATIAISALAPVVTTLLRHGVSAVAVYVGWFIAVTIALFTLAPLLNPIIPHDPIVVFALCVVLTVVARLASVALFRVGLTRPAYPAVAVERW